MFKVAEADQYESLGWYVIDDTKPSWCDQAFKVIADFEEIEEAKLYCRIKNGVEYVEVLEARYYMPNFDIGEFKIGDKIAILVETKDNVKGARGKIMEIDKKRKRPFDVKLDDVDKFQLMFEVSEIELAD